VTGIDIIEFQDPAGERTNGAANRPGSMHLCFGVEDCDGVLSRTKGRVRRVG
jgi:hypothetical protein